ncbi:restriction endonuclease subunit S [Arcticibacter eurypsychrophilus]|uniref:restriction endonuclease subunit S n=1 Tax=Arcticibacter eurypsychrophilus TaxID=1434752 RepID=UPI00084D2C12|nr:restriction endonuclease subunit S [Arcticibacter eurypsychrophilus]
METILQGIDLKNIDRSKWRSYRFDEIAKNISERVDPNDTDLQVYVGLEHIDSESLHIKRTGTPDDVNGTKLRCYPGDIIFGRRRAYQRKAAIATFDGFCSAHSLVLRANPAVIHPKLFPFFIHSDLFMNRAVDISVGSLSPTINWGTLKTQEFHLPPLEEQERLGRLLWRIDHLIEQEHKLLNKITRGQYVYFNRSITSGIYFDEENAKYKSIVYPKSWTVFHLKELLSSLRNGISEEQNLNEKGIKVTRIETISESVINIKNVGFIDTTRDYSKYKLDVGDILFSHINSVAHIGKVALYKEHVDLYHGVNLMRLKADPSLIRYTFLHYLLDNKPAKRFYERRAKQAINQASLDQSDIGSLPLAIPILKVQDLIIKKMEYFDTSISGVNSKLNASKSLQKALINQIFG